MLLPLSFYQFTVYSLQFTLLTCCFQCWSFLYNNTCNCNKGGGNEQGNSHTSNHSCKPTDHRTPCCDIVNMITTCYILGSCIAVVLGLYNRKVDQVEFGIEGNEKLAISLGVNPRGPGLGCHNSDC